jgi:hypothetical protein
MGLLRPINSSVLPENWTHDRLHSHPRRTPGPGGVPWRLPNRRPMPGRGDLQRLPPWPTNWPLFSASATAAVPQPTSSTWWGATRRRPGKPCRRGNLPRLKTMDRLLFGLIAGSGLTWVFMSLRRDGFWREFGARRRGSNSPPPGRKPAPPAGPPEQPLTAQLIRYWAWEQEQVRRAWFDPRMGEPWPEDHKPAPPGGQAAPTLRSAVERLLEAIVGLGDVDDAVQFARAALDADEVRLGKGSTQRGTPPPRQPLPHGGRLIKSWEEPSPPSEP